MHFCFLLFFTVASLLEVWNKKCKKTLQEINQVIHDKKYILFFHHPINFWVYPCTGKRTKYEYSLWEVSAGDQLSIKLNTYLSAKVESVKDVLSEKWEILEKILSFFFSLSTFDFLLFLFVFVIDLFMSYFLISPQWKGLNIRINDLKMHFSKKKICFSSRAQYSSNYLMNSAISKQWGKLSSFIF